MFFLGLDSELEKPGDIHSSELGLACCKSRFP